MSLSCSKVYHASYCIQYCKQAHCENPLRILIPEKLFPSLLPGIKKVITNPSGDSSFLFLRGIREKNIANSPPLQKMENRRNIYCVGVRILRELWCYTVQSMLQQSLSPLQTLPPKSHSAFWRAPCKQASKQVGK